MRLLYTSLLLFCSLLLFAQADSSLMNTVWEETSKGERNGYVLQLNKYGTFEEDAGKAYKRSSQYLMGRWILDTTENTLTLAVDYFLGKNMVASRYRRGRDFYLTYSIVKISADSLSLKDRLTGDVRTFVPTTLATDYEDGATRRTPKPGKVPIFKLPGSGGGWLPGS